MTKEEIELQGKIVSAIEMKKDTSGLLAELKSLRDTIAQKTEMENLRAVAEQRKGLKFKAQAIIDKVEKQSKAINEFLLKRDAIIKMLEPLLEPFKELAKMQSASWEREPGQCYLFNDMGVFAAAVKDIPADYLPEGFGCSFLQMKGGQELAIGKAVEALDYFSAAYGILVAFEKGLSKIPLQAAAEGLLSQEKKGTGK